MQSVLIVIHLILAISLVITVLLQSSEGGALGIGGGGQGGGLVTSRGAANFLTRLTAVLAACFMATSLTLTILANQSDDPGSILDEITIEESAPAEPVLPSVPFSD